MLDIFKNRQDATEQEKTALLKQFRDETDEIGRLAKGELPKIAQALARVDGWVAENISGVPVDQLPRAIGDLLFEIDRLRNTPALIQETLRNLGRVTVQTLWGDRRERDLSRFTAVVIDFKNRLICARGCAAAIDRYLAQLQMVTDEIEEKTRWAQATGTEVKPAAKVFAEKPAAPKSTGPRVDSDFSVFDDK
jgi:hypothetical protein